MFSLFPKKTLTQSGTVQSRPPGPKTINPIGNALAFRRDPLGFLTQLIKQYGDIASFSFFSRQAYLINHPDYVRHVFQVKAHNYDKDAPMWRLVSEFTGSGLATNFDEVSWRRNRRLLQPLFHKKAILAFTSLMINETEAMLEHWEQKRMKKQAINVADEVTELTLRIVSKAIFHDDLKNQLKSFIQSFHRTNQFISDYMRFPFPPLFVPTARHRRFQADKESMDEIVYGIIAKRRKHSTSEDDMLSVLMGAVDEETGEGMTDKEIHDEVISFLMGGAESIATTLTWLWYLLWQHPEVEERLISELDSVLTGSALTQEHFPKLVYARQVIDETLRIYPVGWMSMRNVIQDDVMGNFHVPARTMIFVSPYLLHHNPSVWPEPEHFNPDRFAPQNLAQMSRWSYIPFLVGPHMCIGQHMALQELLIILALVAQRYRLQIIPGYRPKPATHVLLRMEEGLPVFLHPR